MRDYKDAISARNNDWKAEARTLMRTGVEFVVVHLKPEDYRDCRALAKEFGYSECLEDDLSRSQESPKNERFRSPTRIGFVKPGLSASKPRSPS